MTTLVRRSSLALAAAVLAACGADRSAAKRADAVLSDARSDGAPGFYFLPPIAPEPGAGTVNDPGLSPVVQIVALDASGADGAELARFEGGDVKASDSHYMALWSTKRFVPAAGTTYRIRVLLDGKALGYADAQVAKDGKELRLLASSEIFGLTGQRTVPIKFRIHVEPAGDLCAGVTCEAATACLSSACDPESGACVATPAPVGSPCDDGNACTVDACDGSGACASTPLVCEGADQCNTASCGATTGCALQPVGNGKPCTTTTGAAGVCFLPPGAQTSSCVEIPPGKLTR